MPFRHLTLKRPFYNGFVGPVPTGSTVFVPSTCDTIRLPSCVSIE